MRSSGVARPNRWRRVRYTFASMGWRRAAHDVLTTRRPYDPGGDRAFDTRHGTDTGGAVEPASLGIADAARRGQAIRYLPSPERVTRWMLDAAGVDPATHTFVDLGCGKGRVVLLAGQRPFRRVVGVEISDELVAIARQNVARYRPPPALASPIELVAADATTIDLPQTDLLVHLYHPFEPEVTRMVLTRLTESVAAAPRRVTIAYLTYTSAVDEVAEVFAEFDWLHLRRYEQSIRGHYNWLLYGSGRAPSNMTN